MISSYKLPPMTFLAEDGSEERLELSETGPRVNAMADYLRKRLSPGDVVGSIGRTGSYLVCGWLAALVAGLRPLVLQYPTKKQSHTHWAASISNTVVLAGVAALISDDIVASICPDSVTVIRQSDLKAAKSDSAASTFEVRDFSILQLSSGTTGHRKAMEFTESALTRHVADFNEVLELHQARDTIVSWLPLYHDMGYIACFVMPMMLGIPTIMTDPMTWVANPGMLFDAITRHRGTISYMPNFGFEIMAREALNNEHDLSSMRWWISCSEPVSSVTCRRFIEHIGAKECLMAPCYAMAENIFAMTLRRVIATREVQGIEAVSNGCPIPGVEVEVRDDAQIWVRSPTSLKAYMSGESIADESGFYPTGDLGALHEGELYIAGRTQDLIIQAGRKYMLSDIDLIVNRLLPEVKGRAVACQEYDDRLGTHTARVLIEDAAFFRRDDAKAIAGKLKSETGFDQVTVHFVPPRFLTKTSSGKFNRKISLTNWRRAQPEVSITSTDPIAELREAFKTADWDTPTGQALDSLSTTVLRILLADAGMTYDSTLSLNALSEALPEHLGKVDPSETREAEAIHIVSIADRSSTVTLTPAALNKIGARLGRRITFQHLCMPPSAVSLSDLIFHRWYQPLVDGPDYAAVTRAFDVLSKASIIMTDDMAEMYFPPMQVYGVLSHRMERDPRADLVAVRWQRYTQFHDRLPLTVVSGADLPLTNCTQSLDDLSTVLNVPIFRIATLKGFAEFTEGWEFRNFSNPAGTAGGGKAFAADDLTDALGQWCAGLGEALRPSTVSQSDAVRSDDLAHFCSHYVRQSHLDIVLDAFSSFIIAGQPASAPYVRHVLDAKNKPYQLVPSYAPKVLANAKEAEAILICGAQGRYPTHLPTVAVMKADPAWENRNIEAADLRNGSCFLNLSEFPASGEDWYYPLPQARLAQYSEIQSVRSAAKKQAETLRAQRLRRRSATKGHHHIDAAKVGGAQQAWLMTMPKCHYLQASSEPSRLSEIADPESVYSSALAKVLLRLMPWRPSSLISRRAERRYSLLFSAHLLFFSSMDTDKAEDLMSVWKRALAKTASTSRSLIGVVLPICVTNLIIIPPNQFNSNCNGVYPHPSTERIACA
jgi:acyl-CoA synthetase (AMP-forming)/AMP-acid ligase II